jgi:RHS repeat-associated protein
MLSGVSTWFTKTYTLGGVIVATKTDGVVHYVASDHLGSTSVSHTNTGSTGTLTFFPFGAERSRSGFVDTDRTFTGQVSDGDTGLMFYNARYYDPVASRFTQADTILADGPNRYSYVLNNPLARVDPTGRNNEEARMARCGIDNSRCGAKHHHTKASVSQNRDGVGDAVNWDSVANHLDQYQVQFFDDYFLPSGKSLFAEAHIAYWMFSQAISDGTLVFADGWYQPSSCAPNCDGPQINPASEAVGLNASYADEAIAEGTLDMLAIGGAWLAPRVTFGHGARHLEGTALSATQVESQILQQVTAEASQASTTGSFWGRVQINGTTIEYRAYTLADGTINVGTYYVP